MDPAGIAILAIVIIGAAIWARQSDGQVPFMAAAMVIFAVIAILLVAGDQ